MGDFCDDSSSVSESSSSNTDYRSANEAEVDDDEEEEEEESSWTTYIVDFLINGQEKVTPSSQLSHEEAGAAAVVSDEVGLGRRKNKGSLVDRVDDAFEDTASSPIHPPKEEDKGISSSDEVAAGSGRGRGGGGGDSRFLKERGLCLVPLSMVVNYLG